MSTHPGFTAAEWEKAPEYYGPGLNELHQHSRSIVLDFESLRMIAAAQEDEGAFQAGNGLEALKAPIKLGDVPAAFLKIVSLNEDDFLLHTPREAEILVVINGILTIRNSRFANLLSVDADRSGTLRSGDTVALGPEGVRLTAHGLDRQAATLALSITGVHPQQTGLIVRQNIFKSGKEVTPIGRISLPYED